MLLLVLKTPPSESSESASGSHAGSTRSRRQNDVILRTPYAVRIGTLECSLY